MKWRNVGPYLQISNTVPAYKVAKTGVFGVFEYRPSYEGEWLTSGYFESVEDARKVCENHHTINKEAKEIP